MNNLAEIEEQLELLRTKLNDEITKTNGEQNTSEKILKISQELDALVLQYQRLLNKD